MTGGEASIRPYRIGTSSGTRVAACRSSTSTESRSTVDGGSVAWLDRGISSRTALPLAAHCPGVMDFETSATGSAIPTDDGNDDRSGKRQGNGDNGGYGHPASRPSTPASHTGLPTGGPVGS